MSKSMWILFTLLSVLVIAGMYREYINLPLPQHLNCKENWISKKCFRCPKTFLDIQKSVFFQIEKKLDIQKKIGRPNF